MSKRVLIVLLVFVFTPLLAFGSLLLRQPVSFGLVAQTERFEFVVADDARQPIYLARPLVVYLDDDGREVRQPDFQGTFEPAAGARANFQRIGYGRVELRFSASPSPRGAGWLYQTPADGSISQFEVGAVLVAEIAIIYDDAKEMFRQGQPVRVPIEVQPLATGAIEFGASEGLAEPMGQPMLHSGTVTILSRTIVGKQIFVGGETSLDLGDRIKFLQPRTTGIGVALVGDKPGFNVTYRTVAEAAWVTRYRSDGYAITLSSFQYFMGDPIIKAVWGALLAIMGFAGKRPRLARPEPEAPPAGLSQQRYATSSADQPSCANPDIGGAKVAEIHGTRRTWGRFRLSAG